MSPKLTGKQRSNLLWEAICFGLHLAIVYFIAYYAAAWLAGRFLVWAVPVIDPGNQTGSFQFLCSHIFAFTFTPAFAVGRVNARWLRFYATWVWSVPALMLGYKLFAFPTKGLESHWSSAFHYYFAGGFLIGQFRDFKEMFAQAGNPDLWRGIEQLHVTGAFYAGMGYSAAALLAQKFRINDVPACHSGDTRDVGHKAECDLDQPNSENTADTTYPSAPA